MSNAFAKMFDSEKYGQIVVICQGADDTGEPEVRFFFQPPSLSVCSLAMKFSDTDDGWGAQEKAFTTLEICTAEKIVGQIIDNIPA